jgi:uncharacterized protein YcbX
MHIVKLYRYPFKGLSPERLGETAVAAGEGFPLDRAFALLRTDAAFDPAAPAWLPKANFVMLMLHESLAALRTRYDEATRQLRVRLPDGGECGFAVDDEAGRAALGRFFLDYMPKRLEAPPRVLEAPGHQFTDKAEKYVSVINLASVRALEKSWNQSLDPLRFRANVYIDGAEPFRELEWVGREMRLGPVVAEVTQRNGRCAATNVNPETGVRDRNVPTRLREQFGHKDLGIYVRITEGGRLREGDEVIVEPAVQERPLAQSRAAASGVPLCSACYYLLPATVTSAADLPAGYACPDCGAGREAVVANP